MDVAIQHLVKFSGKQKTVDDLSFSISQGEILGIYGKSHSGKTTLMQMLAGIIAPDAGIITYNGEVFTPEALSVKKKIGYLPQSNPLYQYMRVLEFLLFLARLSQLPVTEIHGRVEKIISLCGLENEKFRAIRELSKGYRQRLGIAQVLIHDPELLLLDEPIHGLDPRQTQELQAIIKNVAEHKTVIICSNVWSNISRLCSRMIPLSTPPEEYNTQEDFLLAQPKKQISYPA